MTDLGRVLIAAAERTPHALAVADDERRFDYAAWLDTAGRAAGGLGTLGLEPGDRLAVVMQNRWEMAAADGRCHKDPGMDIKNTTTTRRAKVGEPPMAAKVMAWPSIQAVRMIPQ